MRNVGNKIWYDIGDEVFIWFISYANEKHFTVIRKVNITEVFDNGLIKTNDPSEADSRFSHIKTTEHVCLTSEQAEKQSSEWLKNYLDRLGRVE